ncbi:MAG TPA: GGDEF domain-containing protein [Caldimonas sp.]|nr:GGDEF domain-containing protein [Caldimonas sp.]
MLSSMSATDVAFTMVGLMQAVLGVAWLFGSWLLGDSRRVAVHWAFFAASSAVSFAFYTMALHAPLVGRAESLRAGGNIILVLALIAMQRGIRIFVGRPSASRIHAVALLVTLAMSYAGLSPHGSSLRVGVISLILASLAFGMARDLYRYAGDALRLRRPWLMGLPGLCAAAAFAFRGLRALFLPASVASEMTTDSALNVAAALSYLVIVLSFHATLITLVVGRLLADLRHRTRHDDLTGLLNRRAMEETVAAQIRRSLRSGEPFSVLMLDLDHFKAINDRFGHAAGDQALRHVAGLLQAGVREVDAIARVGGEEFLALMPGATLAAAGPVAERVRAQLAGQPMTLPAGAAVVTVSIGIAEWSDPGEDMSRLLVRADAALYQAKQDGRDRVVEAEPGKRPATGGPTATLTSQGA